MFAATTTVAPVAVSSQPDGGIQRAGRRRRRRRKCAGCSRALRTRVLVDSEECTYCNKSLDSGIKVFGCVPCCTSLCMSCSPFEVQPDLDLLSAELGAGLPQSPDDLALRSDGLPPVDLRCPLIASLSMRKYRRVAASSILRLSLIRMLGQDLRVRTVRNSSCCYWSALVVCPPLFQ